MQLQMTLENNIENIFYNPDIFNIIYEFIPFHTKVFIFKVNKYFRNNIERIMCFTCNEKICCPIEFNNLLYCYKCLDEYKFTKTDKQFWKKCEKIEKKYVYCKYCDTKCSSLEFLHYHIEHKCKHFQPIMPTRQNAVAINYINYVEFII